MKAMIPHHSSAIMVSKNADLQDSEVKKLSIQIIKSQEEEIKQMKEILKRMVHKDDPWKNMNQQAATLNAAMKKLHENQV
jgi:K+/H+ antiporter YhaU regulatory subunit KhtT